MEGETHMFIKEADLVNLDEATELALALWPDNDLLELKEEFREILSSNKDKVFLAFFKQECVAFAHISIRSDYVEGSTTSPVGYVEGIYVKPKYRRMGLSTRLIAEGERWAKSLGCTEMASDIEEDNTDSYAFHLMTGFKEAGRIIHFIKDIDDGDKER